MKILHLTLHRKWFDEIATGKKQREYREIKPYWTARLCELDTDKSFLYFKKFDEVHFHNGYNKNSPFMRVECKGIVGVVKEYCINLGKILEIKNWNN